MPFPVSWLTVEQTAAELMVKPRTVVAMVTQGKLRPRKYQRPGRGGAPISLFDPAEVETLRQQRADTKMEILPAGAPMPAPRVAGPLLRSIDGPAVPVDGRLAAIVATMQAPPRWLRYDEAVVYTGLGESRLREMVNAGKIATDRGPHGSIVLRRADLDKL